MIDKSKESKQCLTNDPCYQKIDKDLVSTEPSRLDKTKQKKDFQLKDLMKLENFVISMNSTWKTFFDTSILVVIGYSCATSVFYVSFDVTS